ncbi:hypothetical protein NEIELOOT_02778 [Neisseria elongata subsp. glycolytica ATCC 29315]|uniref:Uncharacterized protein n=1 Tax=Neisseria elongata subsp. glycolytica ATCC 29315 TaxID=546263 RepID=D4DUU5_NEIEG|nr:hypothetical protein NEIELOOT_02778 [Neisseria elongata subsp. glycolytica ATCC 29315]
MNRLNIEVNVNFHVNELKRHRIDAFFFINDKKVLLKWVTF